ncbi:tRNA (adenosine(37)-N6)-threonylcarbamoyltransferase complex ATPase subunit type 1 TsaE [Pseudoclavibacter sp. 13-3]|uniref:tRNA (adenosine(37)-N6)-threonylcarbamoyltransferase complex ATPase subunit type 1 TsaE n=1 Tax=Pseudoclavibacter sp. 13-3 TaxID=2901228 RepID=UPI001E5DA219|nr:tRNA (adenosine(37)-N6)-threonylcarbamoyltransferase complex ATPase subunit type 1 TsaE [Pseudoclavibacter sp. 13-3]MCD7101089.1 tRNA (adenosine(37)-N6)-threonylcarbamoyltransferase complex ATPase subunit type 1 TsaE [Pseudoclavibacter sp. 13-3]
MHGVDEQHIADLGRRIGSIMRRGDLLVLNGPLGAGKTTLTRSLGEGLGVRGPVTSPTFVLARTHPSQVGGAPLVHVDAYRLTSGIELDDLDLDLEGSATVIEWGRDWVALLADSWVSIDLIPEENAPNHTPAASADAGEAASPEASADAADLFDAPQTRTVIITAHGPRRARDLAARLESKVV